MTHYKSDFLSILDARGFIHQGTNLEALDARAATRRLTAYIGFDATAPSLHAGSLISIMMLYWLQQTGHRPIVLMGGGTSKVGDPTGRDSQRKFLSDADIAGNIDGIKKCFSAFLKFGESGTDAVMTNNDLWLSKINYIEFLRDFGIHFTINRMLSFDSVKLRLERESPMSFLEFNYMLMQAYDFFELNERHGCDLQMGGSDQWGNIVNGVELCRRVAASRGEDHDIVFGLTSPLLTTSAGRKMGKSEGGAIWLEADMLRPYDYWQYWRNAEDADIGRLLRLFTTLPLDEVDRLAALEGAEINDAKTILATEATALVHGRRAAEAAAATAHKVFSGTPPLSGSHAPSGGHAFVAAKTATDLPSLEVSSADLQSGLPLYGPFRELGLISSNSEGMRHIKGGGLKVNDIPLSEARELTMDDVRDGVIKLSIGKKRHAVITVV